MGVRARCPGGESYSYVIIRGAGGANQRAARHRVGPSVGLIPGRNHISMKLLDKSRLIGAQERTRTFTVCTAGT
jgi:hypothetical protein